MTTREKNIKNIIENLNYCTDKEISFIEDIMTLPEYANKHNLINLGNVSTDFTYDTATPINYVRQIEDIYPDFKNGNYIFDYSKNNFGEMTNINNWIVNRILKLK